jgi:AcrR family transcriptional regulator
MRKPPESRGRNPIQRGRRAAPAHISNPPPKPRAPHRPTQHRARATVDAIIEAAGQLLVSQGRAGVTTNAVAERAGVSIGSLYQYFPNKEAIFAALQDQHRDEVMPLIHHTMTNLASDPRLDLVEAIVALMRAMVELHKGNPARMRVLAEELHEDRQAVVPAFVDAIAELLRARTRLTAPALNAVAWLVCATVTHVGWTLVHQPPPLEVEEILAGMGRMLRGLVGPRPRGSGYSRRGGQ